MKRLFAFVIALVLSTPILAAVRYDVPTYGENMTKHSDVIYWLSSGSYNGRIQLPPDNDIHFLKGELAAPQMQFAINRSSGTHCLGTVPESEVRKWVDEGYSFLL